LEFLLIEEVPTILKQVIFNFFKLCDLTPREIRAGVWQVQINEELMKELDGWRAQARLLQFTFDQKLAESYGADLICIGSYRLNSILEVIQKQGIFTHLHISHNVFHEPNIRKKVLNELGSENRVYVVNESQMHGQYLQLKILARTISLEKKESIHTLNVNLSSGEVLKFAISPHLIEPGKGRVTDIRKRKCSFKKAFSNAVDYLIKTPQFADPGWTEKAWETFEQEKSKLRSFFNETDEDDIYSLKVKELKNKYAPKLQIDIMRSAVLFTPLFFYKLILIKPSGQEQSRNVLYDPISNAYELN